MTKMFHTFFRSRLFPLGSPASVAREVESALVGVGACFTARTPQSSPLPSTVASASQITGTAVIILFNFNSIPFYSTLYIVNEKLYRPFAVLIP